VTSDQILLFAILGGVLTFLLWGRWRYDIVAFSALLIAVATGLIPAAHAFSGFGHSATIVVAMVLIVGRGLSRSGVVELIAGKIIRASASLSSHIGVMAVLAAALSSLMNNVAALALLMPLDIETAAKAKRSPALTLMPISFASILGGLVTLIGTPPNIVIATFRAENVGEPFRMFDFAPVGAACAAVGIIFVTLVGWRLIPAPRVDKNVPKDLFKLDDYVAELKVAEDNALVGKRLGELDDEAENKEIQILGLIRNGHPMGASGYLSIAPGDILVVQAGPKAIEVFAGTLSLDYVDMELGPGDLEGARLELMEAVVTQDAVIDGRSALSLGLLSRYGVHLLGVSRSGQRFRERVRQLPLRAGDVMLLLGNKESLTEATHRLGCLPLAERGLQVMQREKASLAILVFIAAIIAASFGFLDLTAALAIVALLYVILEIVPLRDLYEAVEWPVIVLLGSLIPLGVAFESSGGTAIIANGLLSLSEGYSPAFILTVLMIITMTLSDVLNNVATAIIAAPVALEIATRLDVNPDPFLMAVAVSASCAFLTPIGHKNNTLVMGPGGYSFGDYWRMGLPLEILIMLVGVPMILWVWPL
jgi:di/tricarboxylate transporter